MPPGNRPKEIHTKHLTERERFRVRTLYYDASMSKKRIEEVTGYSLSQIRTAIRAKSSAIPPRSGRPKKAGKDNSATDDAGPSSEGFASEDSALVPRSNSPQEALRPQTASPLDRLPPALRRYIWQLVLTCAPMACPLSCVWWVEKLPQYPWLVTGVFPEHWETHWREYLEHRQPAARLLCHLNREARQVVLDTFAPVWSEAGLRMLGSTVKFLWIDPRHDKIYCKDDAAALPDLLDKSRAAVLPDLSHLPTGPADNNSNNGSGGSIQG
ncbi:hypothetical protein F4815DRAFT_164735 [Daldinia loculata]|uniref:uncharacterized protein n=1 Tax=Daldinia loculata TaxID=103429 RepID=UPI0020C3561B|nr:uncharacterized protein F4817DRAFT_360220 [Daldinia loculata]KAI1645144.1 hypothetical protein F4817DRAFT_360220 [Daldinia loculata]KAI2779970.1 hypothetical protein F4815DRAFT_164735 [Daldinia loculata]